MYLVNYVRRIFQRLSYADTAPMTRSTICPRARRRGCGDAHPLLDCAEALGVRPCLVVVVIVVVESVVPWAGEALLAAGAVEPRGADALPCRATPCNAEPCQQNSQDRNTKKGVEN